MSNKQENLSRQHKTPKSEVNVLLETNTKKRNPLWSCTGSRWGWLSQYVLNSIRHQRDVENSMAKETNSEKRKERKEKFFYHSK